MKSSANGTCLEIANTHFPTINKLSNKRVYCGAENNKEKLLFLSTQRLYNKKYKQQRWYGALKRFFLPPIIEKEQPGWLWLLTCGTIVWDTKPILNFITAISLVQSNTLTTNSGQKGLEFSCTWTINSLIQTKTRLWFQIVKSSRVDGVRGMWYVTCERFSYSSSKVLQQNVDTKHAILARTK